MARRSYRELLRFPAFGLYVGEELKATIRAEDIDVARDLFKKAGLSGERVKRIDPPRDRRGPLHRP